MGSGCQQSLKEQCLIRSQDNKLEHFDKALGCGIPHQDPPGPGPGLWQGMQRALFFFFLAGKKVKKGSWWRG